MKLNLLEKQEKQQPSKFLANSLCWRSGELASTASVGVEYVVVYVWRVDSILIFVSFLHKLKQNNAKVSFVLVGFKCPPHDASEWNMLWFVFGRTL
jgi:hypothetical protein